MENYYTLLLTPRARKNITAFFLKAVTIYLEEPKEFEAIMYFFSSHK
jgi:hypothetical protein